jgi:hypothetical protein
MARNRTIYNVLAVYASQVSPSGMQTGASAIKQLSRVQSFDEDFSRNLTDVNQYGNLAAIDRIEVEAPTVNASLSYYLTDGSNERYLGLSVSPSGSTTGSLFSCISGILNKVSDEKNYYLLIADEGNDANNYNINALTPVGKSGVIGIGNGFMTSYSLSAAVGDLPTVSVDFEALNIGVYSNATTVQNVPAVNPENGTKITTAQFLLPVGSTNDSTTQISALQPGDVIMSIPSSGVLGFANTDLKVQDLTLSFDLSRTPLQKLGSRFAFSREIEFPVTATLEVNAEVGDLETSNLADIICENRNYDFTVRFNKPSCGAGTSIASIIYVFKQAKLISQSFSSSIGDNASLSATYEVQLAAPQDTSKGIFISGTYTA